MAKIKFTSFAVLFLAFTLSGCGNQIASVNAQAPASPTPTPVQAVPANCGTNGACAATEIKQWGYCQYETHQYGKSFTVSLEIGIKANQTDPSTSNCLLPLAGNGGNITSINGTVNYLPWTANVSSMALRINSNGDGCDCGENALYAGKLTVKSAPVSLPISQVFITPIPAKVLYVLFNDDLATAKPTTISIALAGTLQ